MAAALAITGLVASAVGTGVSYYGQQEAARSQEQFSQLNSQAALAQSQMQQRIATSQAALSAQQQRNSQQSAQVQANAARNEAEQVSKIAQVNIGRQMQEQARVKSMMRAKGGSSGTVVGQGSQLDLLAEAARLQNLENAESVYQANVQMRSLYRQAEGAQIGADTASIQAGIELMQGEARASAFKSEGVQARIRGLAGVDAARGASLGALGGAVSGFGSLGFKAFELERLGAFRFQS